MDSRNWNLDSEQIGYKFTNNNFYSIISGSSTDFNSLINQSKSLGQNAEVVEKITASSYEFDIIMGSVSSKYLFKYASANTIIYESYGSQVVFVKQ